MEKVCFRIGQLLRKSENLQAHEQYSTPENGLHRLFEIENTGYRRSGPSPSPSYNFLTQHPMVLYAYQSVLHSDPKIRAHLVLTKSCF
jgi:hypothetical protein